MKNWGLLACLFIATFTASAQAVYTLEDCIRIALNENLGLRLAKLDIEQNAINLWQSRYNRVPSLGAGISQGYNFGRSVDPSTNQFISQTIRSNNLNLSSSVTLFNGFIITNTISRNKKQVAASTLSLQKQANDLQLQIVQGFLAASAAKQQIAASADRIRQSKVLIERVDKQIAAGTAPMSAKYDLLAQQANENTLLIRNQNTYKQQLLTLKQLINLSQAESFEIALPKETKADSTYVPEKASAIFATAAASLPEIRQAEQNVEVAQLSERIARGSFYPTLSLNGNAFTNYSSARNRIIQTNTGTPTNETIGLLTGTGDTVKVPLSLITSGTGNSFKTEKYPFSSQLSDNVSQSVSFQLTIPIFSNFRIRANAKSASLGVRRAQLNLQNAKNVLMREIEQAILDFETAKATQQSLKAQKFASAESLRMRELRFNEGLLNQADYFFQRNEYDRVQRELLQAEFELIFRIKQIDFYLGKPLGLN